MSKTTLKKILVVDDDPGDVSWLKKVLSSDYVVLEADDGLQAVEMAHIEKPDLILMDVMMPKTSGYTACVRIKSDHYTKDIPVVMVTGLCQELNRKFGKEMGADGYLVKPLQPNQLRNAIARFLSAT